MEDVSSKTLITGAGGMVGSYVDFGIRLTHADLDITDEKSVIKTLAKHKPKAIIHLAAATDLKRCEEDPDYAYRVNAVGTYNIALVAKSIGAKMIYVSTNSVFDGLQSKPYEVSDIPNPKSVYGHSKYLGELAVKGILEDYAIVRTAWIFGGGRNKDQKFVGKIIEKIEQGSAEIEAIENHFGSPTYGKDLIKGMRQLLTEDLRGIFHIVNSGICSREEEIKDIIRIKGAKATVKPVPPSTFGLPEGSLYESLSPSPALLRPWQDALKEYLNTEW